MTAKSNPRIAIVGGGISGLSAAWQLCQSAPHAKVTLFESKTHLGGALRTEQIGQLGHPDNFLIEQSADMFLSEPDAAVRLCQELGIADQLIKPNPKQRYSYVVRNGQLQRIPIGFALMAPAKIWPVLKSPIFSLKGKLRFLAEWFSRPAADKQDESLRSFAVRHFGEEVFQRLIQPLVAGIYSARADQLSIQATLDRFVKMEAAHGSLLKAARTNRQKSASESAGARYGLFFALSSGMQSLVDNLVEQMPNIEIRTDTRLTSLSHQNGWEARTSNTSEQFDAVILATPANAASRLMINVNDELASILESFQFGSMVVVCIGCRQSCFAAGTPTGFGFVVPEIENRDIIACSFSSNKFEGRASAGDFLMRCFLGGPQGELWSNAEDKQLIEAACRELSDLIGFQPQGHEVYRVLKWTSCLPQYLVGHQAKVRQLQEMVRQHDGLELAGNSYGGVGIPACIQSGRNAALRVIDNLAR